MYSALSPYSPEVICYQVIVNGVIVFQNTCYSLCNGYIFQHALMGVRPKPLYDTKD